MFKCRYLPFKHTIFENRKFTSKNHSKNVRLKKPTKRKQNQLINKKRKTIITINVNSPDSFIKSIGFETGCSQETQKANRKADYNGK